MNEEENLLLKLAKIGSTYPSDPDAPRDGAANYGKPLREKWRIQADDPIEKCEEAKEQFVWVIFPKRELFDKPKAHLCFLTYKRTSMPITLLTVFQSRETGDIRSHEHNLKTTDIDRWQLIPTPPMPSNMTAGEDEEPRAS